MKIIQEKEEMNSKHAEVKDDIIEITTAEIEMALRRMKNGKATGPDNLPVTHSLIWRPSRVADTLPLLPISRYGYCPFVADVCLCSEVLQPGGSRSSSGSGSM